MAITFLLLAAFGFSSDLTYADFASPAGLKLVGAARTRDAALRLTPSKAKQRGAVWHLNKLPVRDGFETAFRFRISDRDGLGPGADGFAFVIQNNGPTALAGEGASGGFGLGYSPGDRNPAIANSLAVFFDTFQNQEDESGNAISICTNGGKRQQMRWPPPRLAINWSPRVQLQDGETHQVRIVFSPPFMTVYVDGQPAVRAPVDLGRMVGPDGSAYVGFTASTGEGYENHDLLDWSFRPNYVVSSSIAFAPFDCVPAKSLCTPVEAVIEAIAPGRYRVILPAHRPAEIPNPQGLPVEIVSARGTACSNAAAGNCGGPSSSPELTIRQNTGRGRTSFALDGRTAAYEGYFEFEAVLLSNASPPTNQPGTQ